ncbi:ABC transporter substrate-binding protein [Actinoplanes sp. NPDC051861]|uniref:ABC transporter substrate-binding protein n=1 Tax=Actinoplanes sp. NPDC051861 TaxID=3155170 RepID=UPI003433F974
MIGRLRGLPPYLLVAVLTLAGAAGYRAAAPAPRSPSVAALPPIVFADSVAGPAPVPDGARRGGTVTVLVNGSFEHLDPARTYVAADQVINLLLQRTLTAVRHRPGGAVELVGDLATDTGRPSEGGRVWTFTLRPGLRFADGSPINSKDIGYAIARSFSRDLPDGPTHLQRWLAGVPAFAERYPGPYERPGRPAPGVSTPDARTLVLRFPQPRTDVPFAAASGTTTPVPHSRDTGPGYDEYPVSTGPYRIASHDPGRRMVLVRNPFWAAETDPVRSALPDRFDIRYGQSPAAATSRILAGTGDDAAAVSLEQVPSAMLLQVAEHADLARRVVVGPTPYVFYLKINTERVTDLAVRRALNCAFDRSGYIRTIGGAGVAEPATTILPRIAVGFRSYDAYPCGPSGDAGKARVMLGGRSVPLRYGFRDTEQGRAVTAFLTASLGRAGFDLTTVPVPADRYYSTINSRRNGLDLYPASWGADWPTGQAVIPPIADGRGIREHGNSNSSYLDDPGVNAEIDRISGIVGGAEAGAAWATLDERIMRDLAPLVPIYYDRNLTLAGRRVGGVRLHRILGLPTLTDAYVEPVRP